MAARADALALAPVRASWTAGRAEGAVPESAAVCWFYSVA